MTIKMKIKNKLILKREIKIIFSFKFFFFVSVGPIKEKRIKGQHVDTKEEFYKENIIQEVDDLLYFILKII